MEAEVVWCAGRDEIVGGRGLGGGDGEACEVEGVVVFCVGSAGFEVVELLVYELVLAVRAGGNKDLMVTYCEVHVLVGPEGKEAVGVICENP